MSQGLCPRHQNDVWGRIKGYSKKKPNYGPTQLFPSAALHKSPVIIPSTESRRTGSGFLVGGESDEERAVPAGGRHGGARFRADGPTFHRTPQLI